MGKSEIIVMEEQHKQQIIDFTPIIVKLFNYTDFREKCLQNEIVIQTMIDNIEKKNISNESRFEALLKKITLRGPNAYCKTVNILLEMSIAIIVSILTIQNQLCRGLS